MVDGRGLANQHDVGKIHKWIVNGSSQMNGREFIGGVQWVRYSLRSAQAEVG